MQMKATFKKWTGSKILESRPRSVGLPPEICDVEMYCIYVLEDGHEVPCKTRVTEIADTSSDHSERTVHQLKGLPEDTTYEQDKFETLARNYYASITHHDKDDWFYGFVHKGIALCPPCGLQRGFRKIAIGWRIFDALDLMFRSPVGMKRDGWYSIIGTIGRHVAGFYDVDACIECKKELNRCAIRLQGILVDVPWRGNRSIEGFQVKHLGNIYVRDDESE